MKIVICTGSPWSNVNQVGTTLISAGLHPPAPSADSKLTIESLHAQIETTYKIDNLTSNGQAIHPGDITALQALDILQSNPDQELTGWTHPLDTWLLDFWKSLDLDIYFILAYSSPEEDIARFMLQDIETSLSSESAAELWFSYNTQLLRFYNRNRDRCVLLSSNNNSGNSSHLTTLCNERFNIALQTDTDTADPVETTQDTVASVLAQSFLQDNDELYKLYDEIQATATLPNNESANTSSDKAWEAYSLTRHRAAEQQEQLKTYRKEQKESQRQLKEFTEKLSEQTDLLEKSQSEHKQSNEENELLLLQLHQVQEELETTFISNQESQNTLTDLQERHELLKSQQNKTHLQQEECTTKLTDQIRLLDEKQTSVKQYKQKTETLQKELEQLNNLKDNTAESDQLLSKSTELEQENELLLLQLHQVQEELEHYFLLHQECQTKQEIQKTLIPSDGRIHLEMSEISGAANWYPMEEFNEQPLRWSGPGSRATLILPINLEKEQLLVIHYEQLLTEEQLSTLSIEVNGKPVSHKVHNKSTQKFIAAELNIDTKETSKEIELAIIISPMIRPSDIDSYSPDDRLLGISVYSISILPVNPKLHINWPETTYRQKRLKRNIKKAGGSIDTFPLAYFDGKTYLKQYPDVAEAVRQGNPPSAFIHYVQNGYLDGHHFSLADTQMPSEGNEQDLIQIENETVS